MPQTLLSVRVVVTFDLGDRMVLVRVLAPDGTVVMTLMLPPPVAQKLVDDVEAALVVLATAPRAEKP